MNNDNQDGFTLLELMVALAVFSLLVLGLSQGLRFGIQGWQAQTRETHNLADLDAIDRLLRGLLTSMNVRSSPALSGTPHSLGFVGSLPRAAPPAIRTENITLVVTGDHNLALSWTPLVTTPKYAPAPKPTVTPILAGVADIKIAYYRDAGSPGDGKPSKAGWLPRWDASQGIPALIRIHIDFTDGDPRHWPDILIAPMVDGK